MNITFQVEDYLSAIPEMSKLYPEHWEEVALDKDVFRVDPDYARYETMARAGVLHVVTARADGELVGYYIAMISPHLHYALSVQAFTDIYFLRREYRSDPWVGYKLLSYAVETLKARGVERIYMGHKLHIDAGPMLLRLGFRPIERLYTLTLKGAKHAPS